MHKIFEDIEKKSVGGIVFDVLDPFGEYSAPTKDTKELIRGVINEKMYFGKGELRNMYNGIMRFIKNLKGPKDFSKIDIEGMVEVPVSNMAENWMTVFQNLPPEYEERLRAEWLGKKRQKRRKDKGVCLYEFIDDFRTGKKQNLHDVLEKIPINMAICRPEKMGKRYQLAFVIYREKLLYKVVLKTIRYILEQEEDIMKKKRKGEKLEEAEIRTGTRKNSTVEDVFGIRIVSPGLSSLKAKIIEFMYNNRNYTVVDDEDYYKNPKEKDKKSYGAHHITLQSHQSWDFIEAQFLTIDDFLNNDFWKLSHPNKDVHNFNMMSKDRRFKELYRKGEFLVDSLEIR